MYRASNRKCIETLNKELETHKEKKDVVDGKLARLLKSSKDLESLIESQRPAERPTTNKAKTVKKPTVKYAKMYRRPSKKPTELETLKEEKDVVDGKLARLLKSSKDLENLIQSQRSDKVKEGVGYNDVPPPTADLYLSPKKICHGLVYPNLLITQEPTDSILSKPAVKFVKAVDRPAERPTINKAETVKKPTVKYAEMYRRPSKKPTDCRKRVQRETTRSQNHAYVSPSHRPTSHRSYGAPMRPSHRPAGHRPYGPPMRPMRSNINGVRPKITSAVRPQYRAPWVPTVNRNFPPVNRKLPTGNSNVSTVCCCCSRHVNTARPKAVINRRNRVKDVQASACWVWKPVKHNSASIILKRYDYVDVRGRSSEDKKKQRNKKLKDSEAEHQV
nr:hypothetical protein [Tanacetum cinerariifolium]